MKNLLLIVMLFLYMSSYSQNITKYKLKDNMVLNTVREHSTIWSPTCGYGYNQSDSGIIFQIPKVHEYYKTFGGKRLLSISVHKEQKYAIIELFSDRASSLLNHVDTIRIDNKLYKRIK